MGTRVLLCAVILAWTFSSGYAEEPGTLPSKPTAVTTEKNGVPTGPVEQVGSAPTAKPASGAKAEKSSNLAINAEGNVSLDFRDADIQNVLRILAFKSGVNIVSGPEVTGLVTIKLQNVPWKRALSVIVDTYGFAFEQKDNIITVTTIENMKKRREDAKLLSAQEPLTTKTFTLNYAKADKIIGSIDKMRTERGSINYDERTNSIIVRDTAANVELIGEVIAKLDTTTPQVLIEAKVVETTLSDSENMGIDWTVQATATGSKRPMLLPFDGRNSSLRFIPDDFPATTTGFTYGTLDFTAFQAVLKMLSSRTDTNVLSNPRLVTLDNQPARINVGSQYPIPKYTYNEEQARLQVSDWEYKDIGVIFEVTPHVNNAGFVTVDLKPQVTDILDYVTVENTSLPRLSNEEAKTSVMIKDGETLVIAGLIKDRVTEIKKKVPFVGDIPLLGALFKSNSKTVSKTELLIFLTPHIIKTDKP